jgi:hypothetical protein
MQVSGSGLLEEDREKEREKGKGRAKISHFGRGKL